MELYWYRCRIVRVVDGDTVHIDWDLGRKIHVVDEVIRLGGVNTPEMNTNAGKVAKAYVEDWFEARPNLIVHTDRDKKEDYGRYLGYFYDADHPDEPSLNQTLVDQGLATLVYGGIRG